MIYTHPIESYERDIIATDGAVLHLCYRLVRNGDTCDIYDMRLESRADRPLSYSKGQSVGLQAGRLQENIQGNGMACRIGKVWIGATGEWNVERSPHETGYLPINRCLRLLEYPRPRSN